MLQLQLQLIKTMTFATKFVSAEEYNKVLLKRSQAKNTPTIVSRTEQRHRIIVKELSGWRKDILKEEESGTKKSGSAKKGSDTKKSDKAKKSGKAKMSGKADDQQLVETVVTDIENNENGTLRRSQRKRAIPK